MTGKTSARGARSLADLVGPQLTPACRRRGLADATLLMAWEDVAPAELARQSWVERIEWPRPRPGEDARDGEAAPAPGATLVVGATPGAALVLSHATAELVERINRVFGWRAVERVRVVRARRPRSPSARAPRLRPDAAACAAAASEAEGIVHEKLKDAVARLGANVIARASTRKREAP